MDPFAVLCDRLQAPHPLLQRIAVSSIFQRLDGSALMQAGSGKEALMRCLASQQPCIVDQSVRELCNMAKSGKISLAQALLLLQASLDSVASSTSLQVLVSGIGFVCRLHVEGSDNKITVHPLLKALQSREEASSTILQQVRLILLHARDHKRAMEFMHPFLTHVFLEPSRMRTIFARQLHSSLCVVASSRACLGAPLMKLLLQYAQSRFLEFPQDIEILFEDIHQLVDLLDENSEMMDFACSILDLVFNLWHESKARHLPCLPFVSLLHRINSLPIKPQKRSVYLASLAYFLTVSELEREQLLILSLAQSWFGRDISLQAVLFWIFPTLHTLASPSGLLKNAASLLLGKIDCFLNDARRQMDVKTTRTESLQLGGIAYELLCLLWIEPEFSYRDVPEKWFKNVTHFLSDSDFPTLVAILTTALTFHPSSKISTSAIDSLAALGRHHPVWGISLFPVFLFSLKYHLRHPKHTKVAIALLNALPSICGHSTILPLCMHLLQPMVEYNADLNVQATSIRLICKICKHTDRAYPYLLRTLVPSCFSQTELETDVLLSKAISLRELCVHDPDAGIELVLSVQSCIESRSPLVQALGLQSLSSLCGDDAIDFYTAWKVIAKLFLPLPKSPTVSQSLCMLLKHGALDAATNPEDVHVVLNALLEFSSCDIFQSHEWSKTRLAALESLNAYEVEILKDSMMQDGKHVDILLREANMQAEELVIKFLHYEHRNRLRATADKVIINKLGKMLESVPRTYSDLIQSENPGAFLLLWNEILKKDSKKATLKSEEVAFQRVLLESANHINVAGDLIMMFISLRTWSRFMDQWLKFGVRLHGNGQRACEQIIKTCIDVSDEGSPRVHENATLALAALLQLQSRSQASVTSSYVLTYLESRMTSLQYQSSQWSAAICIGVLTTCIHATDWKIRSNALSSLIQLASSSENPFVVGAAAVGLGFACESLILFESSLDTTKGYDLLSDVLLCILEQLCDRCPQSSSAILDLIHDSNITSKAHKIFKTDNTSFKNDADSFWAIVGLVWALGSCMVAFSKSGNTTLVSSLTQLIVSWIPASIEDVGTMSLSTGASLVISTCLQVSDKLELVDSGVMESLLTRLGGLVRQIMDLPLSKRSSQPWLAHVFKATCIGYGCLAAMILNTGVHPLSSHNVRDLLDTFQRGYTQMESAQYCFGAMLGLANALGAGITLLESENQEVKQLGSTSLHAEDKVTTPLLVNSTYEETIRTMLQQIVRISHASADSRLKDSARWSLAIIHTAWLRRSQGVLTSEDDSRSSTAAGRWSYQAVNLSSLPDHGTLRLLCEWLSSIGLTRVDIPCAAAISVMRCLEEAPRLPLLDWGGSIRRIMQHNEWFAEDSSTCNSSSNHGEVRKRCLMMSLRHGDKVPPLAGILDDICEGSRLWTVETGLQALVLNHLGDFNRVFSVERMKRLLADVIQVLRKLQNTDEERARECRIQCWKGLAKFWEVTDTKELLEHVENCMEQLTYLSPGRFSHHSETEETRADKTEWAAALECLKHARTDWLLDVFKVDKDNFPKVAFIRSRLAGMNIVPLSSLKAIRSRLLEIPGPGQSLLLTEIAMALKAAPRDDKMEWLLDTIDTANISRSPSTAIYLAALLTSIWSPDSFLVALSDEKIVAHHFPHGLRRLTAQKGWSQSGGVIATKLLALAERLKNLEKGDEEVRHLRRVLQGAVIAIRELATQEMLVRLANFESQN